MSMVVEQQKRKRYVSIDLARFMTSSIPLAQASQIQRGDYMSKGMDTDRTEELESLIQLTYHTSLTN